MLRLDSLPMTISSAMKGWLGEAFMRNDKRQRFLPLSSEYCANDFIAGIRREDIVSLTVPHCYTYA